MDMIVETGLGVPGANSYVTLGFADDYFLSHPFYAENWEDIWDNMERKKSLLIAATTEVDIAVSWPGYRVFTGQILSWPRSAVYDSDGVLQESDSIPLRLKQAVCEMAMNMMLPGNNPNESTGREGISELKIDVIQLKFEGSQARPALPSAVVRLLRGLWGASFSSRVARVMVRV